ncbi:MAG: hypothetical protein QOK39_912 [Acidimicrobiaceae bacterium]|jgi:hypothetical protein|nr:hypothetical protein [Acidimicrobiaceae bacterium]
MALPDVVDHCLLVPSDSVHRTGGRRRSVVERRRFDIGW